MIVNYIGTKALNRNSIGITFDCKTCVLFFLIFHMSFHLLPKYNNTQENNNLLFIAILCVIAGKITNNIYTEAQQYHNVCVCTQFVSPLPLYPIKKTKFMWLDSTAIIISKRLLLLYTTFEMAERSYTECAFSPSHAMGSFMVDDMYKKGQQKKKKGYSLQMFLETNDLVVQLHLLIIHL